MTGCQASKLDYVVQLGTLSLLMTFLLIEIVLVEANPYVRLMVVIEELLRGYCYYRRILSRKNTLFQNMTEDVFFQPITH